MDWNRGYSAEYYATFVDPHSWADTERFEILGGSVDHVETSLRESASIETTAYMETTERIVRIWMDTRQGGASDHVALFTGLAISPEKRYNGNLNETPMQCYSVLKAAEDVLLPRGWYCSGGTDGAKAVEELLRVAPAPVAIDGVSPKLAMTIIAEEGESNLSMSEKILLAIGWRIRLDGRGVITLCPISSTPVASFDPVENDCIEPQLTVSDDWFSIPNCYMAIQDDNTAVARDENPDSPFSIQNRGREVWTVEKNATRADNETLAMYSSRRLKEAQARAITADYNRAYRPDVLVGDVITLNYPLQKTVGNYMITSQNITLGYGASVSEKVKKL